MGKREGELLARLFMAVVPILLNAVVQGLEAVVGQDLNKDGVVGFKRPEDAGGASS